MALGKAITSPNGVVTNYHRVVGAKFKFEREQFTVALRVASYVSDTVRQAEIDAHEYNVLLNATQQQLDELVANASEENEQQRQELSEALNNLHENPVAYVEQYHAVEREYDNLHVLEEELTLEGVYNKLKQLPEFADAVDV